MAKKKANVKTNTIIDAKKVFKIPLYSGRLTVIITNNFPSVVKKYGLDSASEFCDAMAWNRDNYYFCVLSHDVRLSVISHEALHIVYRIYRFIGAKANIKNGEPDAYLLEWVVECILDTIIKARNESKPGK